jgi:tetratricopeptide (TPR) repeat protein
MGRTEVFRVALGLAALWLLTAGSLQAQFGSLPSPRQAPQARSQDELDSYLEIVTSTEPREVIRLVDAFVRKFSVSELLSSAYDAQLHAYERLDDLDGMLVAGRLSLSGSPNNLNTLLSLSSALANRPGHGPDRDRLLAEASDYAERALLGMDRIRISRKLPLEQLHVQKRQMQSEAHGVLGLVALQRGQFAAALSELGSALTLATKPEGVLFLRLGVAQASAGNRQDAEENLRRAAELGPDPVRNIAVGELNKLKASAPSPR